MIGFDIPSRKKIITKRFLNANSTAAFGVECEVNVLNNNTYTINGISGLNGQEGYIKLASINDNICYVFIPFNDNTQHPIKYIGGGLPMDYGQGFNYAEIFDNMIWVDYNGIVTDYTI